MITPQNQEAVLAAKELFWRQGYEQTSVSELVHATKLNRYAIYNAYGGKKELFLACLDAYFLERKSIFLKSLHSPICSPMDAIERVFDFAIREMAERETGCLICNVATDVGHYDQEVHDRVDQMLEEIEVAYRGALQLAAEAGELDPKITPGGAASMLMTLKFGFGVHATNGTSQAQMLQILKDTMALLRRDPQTAARANTGY